MNTELINLEDGTVEIVVRADGGFEEHGWVSSHHLVHSKERQLMQAIYRKAEAAMFSNLPAPTPVCDI
jgi:hypothetical protein